jgi:hypothetical protein
MNTDITMNPLLIQQKETAEQNKTKWAAGLWTVFALVVGLNGYVFAYPVL